MIILIPILAIWVAFSIINLILTEWKEKCILVSSFRCSWKQSFWFHRLIWGSLNRALIRKEHAWLSVHFFTYSKNLSLVPSTFSGLKWRIRSWSPWFHHKGAKITLLCMDLWASHLIWQGKKAFQNCKQFLYFIGAYQSLTFLHHSIPSMYVCMYTFWLFLVLDDWHKESDW